MGMNFHPTRLVRRFRNGTVLSAPRSPLQGAYVERVIGTIRRECLDHVIVLNEASLYRHVKSFLAYYHIGSLRPQMGFAVAYFGIKATFSATC
jgi:hypothetical protein